jgi:hypothetical protein
VGIEAQRMLQGMEAFEDRQLRIAPGGAEAAA